MNKAALLIEIGTEEMPPNALLSLGESFANSIQAGLRNFHIEHGDVSLFVTPRRLGVLVFAVANKQPAQQIEKKGPKLSACYDTNGQLTKAAMGFLSSLSIALEDCEQAEHLIYKKILPGKALVECLPDILQSANDTLPIPKRMRWSDLPISFVRPIHWFVARYGNQTLPIDFLGFKATHMTYGHRFHTPHPSPIEHAEDYPQILANNYVVGDWKSRQTIITKEVQHLAATLGGTAIIDESVLSEVTGLVEYPVIYHGKFDPTFLQLPKACLLSTMQKHQRYFSVCDNQDNLLPYFIFVSNTETVTPNTIVSGNERVLAARLSDANFFYHQDLKIPLENHLKKLDQVVFQEKLGSLGDKTRRLIQLIAPISQALNIDIHQSQTAAKLCKCDLLTHMVYEFPELQGIMGHCYAKIGNIPSQVAAALEYYYYPRFAQDSLPPDALSQALSLTDKLDTIVGIFGIGLEPTGNKDPFALRRAALGLARIIIEKELTLDLPTLIETAVRIYTVPIIPNTAKHVHTFILERLQHYWLERGFSIEMVQAVTRVQSNDLLDAQKRLHALKNFLQQSIAADLIGANKRVFNLLKKQAPIMLETVDCDPNPNFFENEAEKQLFFTLDSCRASIAPLLDQKKYDAVLVALSALRDPIDTFFTHVMVMVEDPSLQKNRLLLLAALRQLFCKIADFADL